VGGGGLGWSSAFHLKRSAPKLDVCVIDANLDRSSALRGAGGLRAQHAHPLMIEFSLRSLEEVRRFHEVTGEELEVFPNGYLMVATTDESAAALELAGKLQTEHGVRLRQLTDSELSDRFPGVRFEDVRLAHLGLDDCLVSSAKDVVMGYRRAAERLGATHVAADAMSAEGQEIELTDGSRVFAQTVALTPGVNAAAVGSLFGIDLDIRPERHQLGTWAWLGAAPDWPMIVELPSTFHFRPYGKSVLIGYDDERIRETAAFSLEMPAAEAVWAEAAASAMNRRCPTFDAGLPTTETWAGWYAVTPDHLPYLGRKGHVVVAAGFGGHGIMHSPIAGQIVSDLCLEGKTDRADIAELGLRNRIRKDSSLGL
jgi:sarcosine oxidase subunit beta